MSLLPSITSKICSHSFAYDWLFLYLLHMFLSALTLRVVFWVAHLYAEISRFVVVIGIISSVTMLSDMRNSRYKTHGPNMQDRVSTPEPHFLALQVLLLFKLHTRKILFQTFFSYYFVFSTIILCFLPICTSL